MWGDLNFNNGKNSLSIEKTNDGPLILLYFSSLQVLAAVVWFFSFRESIIPTSIPNGCVKSDNNIDCSIYEGSKGTRFLSVLVRIGNNGASLKMRNVELESLPRSFTTIIIVAIILVAISFTILPVIGYRISLILHKHAQFPKGVLWSSICLDSSMVELAVFLSSNFRKSTFRGVIYCALTLLGVPSHFLFDLWKQILVYPNHIISTSVIHRQVTGGFLINEWKEAEWIIHELKDDGIFIAMALSNCGLAEFHENQRLMLRFEGGKGDVMNHRELRNYLSEYITAVNLNVRSVWNFIARLQSSVVAVAVINRVFGLDLYLIENGSGCSIAERIALVTALAASVLFTIPTSEQVYARDDLVEILKKLDNSTSDKINKPFDCFKRERNSSQT